MEEFQDFNEVDDVVRTLLVSYRDCEGDESEMTVTLSRRRKPVHGADMDAILRQQNILAGVAGADMTDVQLLNECDQLIRRLSPSEVSLLRETADRNFEARMAAARRREAR